MKPIASPLNIVDVAIMQLEYQYVPFAESGNPELKDIFDDYEIDIDFSINVTDFIHVLINAEVNRDKVKKPGYSIFAEVACVFAFNKSIDITDDTKKHIEDFSTIYIALNNLRSFISQITSGGPVGRYILPSVDLNDLIKKKKEEHAAKAIEKPTLKKRVANK